MNYGETKTVMAAGRHLRLVHSGGWEWAERLRIGGIVAIVAATEDRKLILVEQFRRPIERMAIELPAGLAGDVPGEEGEELAQAARRELLEETGYHADAMEPLIEGPTSAGLCSEIVTFFRARGLKKLHAGGGDASEEIRVHETPIDGIDHWLAERAREGRAVDPKIYAALHFLSRAE